MTIKPGSQTTEFWVIVATLIVDAGLAIAQALGLHISVDASHTLLLAQALPVAYATLRTWLKAHGVTVPSDPSQVPDLGTPVALPAAPDSPAVSAI